MTRQLNRLCHLLDSTHILHPAGGSPALLVFTLSLIITHMLVIRSHLLLRLKALYRRLGLPASILMRSLMVPASQDNLYLAE